MDVRSQNPIGRGFGGLLVRSRVHFGLSVAKTGSFSEVNKFRFGSLPCPR